jgi:hypothetical protein
MPSDPIIWAVLTFVVGAVAILGIAIVASSPRRHELRLPMARVASGLALGAGALALLATAAAMRDGHEWPTAAMSAGVVVGAGVALGTGAFGIRRSVAPQASAAAIRVGSGILLGTSGLAIMAGVAFVRDAGVSWLLVDAGLLIAIVAVGALGIAWLRRRSARPSLLRAWAIASIGLLIVAGLAIVLD